MVTGKSRGKAGRVAFLCGRQKAQIPLQSNREGGARAAGWTDGSEKGRGGDRRRAGQGREEERRGGRRGEREGREQHRPPGLPAVSASLV